MNETTKGRICKALAIGGGGKTVSQICRAIAPPGEPPADKSTVSKIVHRWLEEGVVVKTGTAPLPHGGKEGIFVRVGEPSPPKPRRQAWTGTGWTPPCRYPSVFHFAQEMML